jgi:hypothetical protein
MYKRTTAMEDKYDDPNSLVSFNFTLLLLIVYLRLNISFFKFNFTGKTISSLSIEN